MVEQRINIRELRQLIKLKKEGISNRKIAELLNVSRNTVNEYIRFFMSHASIIPELSEFDQPSLLDLLPSTSQIEKYRYNLLNDFDKELKKPGCTLQTLWTPYLENHPDGYQHSQFCHHFSIGWGR